MSRRRLFPLIAGAIPVAVALLCGWYLFGVRQEQYRIVHALVRQEWARWLVFNRSAFHPLIRTIVLEDDGPNGSNDFETTWDTNSSVLLSRRMFVPVEMFGQPRYAYRPNFHKLSFVTGAGAGYQKVETEDRPALREALSHLNPLWVATATYDAAGHRRVDAALEGTCDRRVLFLGDSFTDGFWVEDRDTFVNQYGYAARRQTRLRVCPTNAGVNGYGSLEEAFVLERDFVSQPADIVVLMYFANDVDNNFPALLAGQLEDAGSKWESSLAYVRRMARFSRSRRAAFVLAPVPTVQQLATPSTRRHYQDILERVAREEGATFIDLLGRLGAHGSAEELFWRWDPHLTPRGHAAVADILAAETAPLLRDPDRRP